MKKRKNYGIVKKRRMRKQEVKNEGMERNGEHVLGNTTTATSVG